MRYKLSWNPSFTKQSQSITGTDQYEEAIAQGALNDDGYQSVTGIKDLVLAMTDPFRAKLGQILVGSLLLQGVSISSVLLGAHTLSRDLIWPLPIIALVYVGLRIVHTFLANWMIFSGNRMAVSMTGGLIHRIGHHIASLSPTSQKAFSSGNLKTMAITDAQTVGDLIHSAANRGTSFLFAPFIAPVILFYLGGWAGIWAYLSMLVMIPFSILCSKRMMVYFNAELKMDDECTTTTGEWLKHQKTARMMQAGDYFERKITGSKRQSFGHAKLGMYWAAFIFGLASRWWLVPPVVMIAASFALKQGLTIESIIGSTWYLGVLTGQLMAIPDLIVRGGKAIAAFKRLVALLGEPQVQASLIANSGASAGERYHRLSLNDVSLTIDQTQILRDINLDIDLGKKIAVIGPLGAGKSTLLSLISGHLFPSDGEVLLHNRRSSSEVRQEHAYKVWREQQVLVTQEPFVETSNVKSNIQLQDAQDSDSKLLQSIYDAAMTQDVEQFERGVHQTLGETGINLSGGQKQRLNLARALYTNRQFLILDDPMSAVDEAVADHLWERLNARGHGFIMVTHRMKYVEECDQVIVMKDGKVAEYGSPKMLKSQKNSHFVRMQNLSNLGGL